MSNSVAVYWSFRSPYSYVVLPRLVALSKQFDVTLDMRIVHPAAIRNPAYFRAMNTLARPYFFLDTARAAAFQGMPFRRPRPDPITQDPVTLAIAQDHPLAHRLGRLGVAAVARGRGLPFCEEVSRLLWDGAVEGWNEGMHLAQAAARAGLDLAELRGGGGRPAGARRDPGGERRSAARSRALGGAHNSLCGRAVLRPGSRRRPRLAPVAARRHLVMLFSRAALAACSGPP